MAEKEHIARVIGKDLPVSTKQSIEICNFIRGKNLQKAKTMLDSVISEKIAVPFTRFNKDMGHKKGKIAAGRFPIKTSKHVLKLLNSLEINAQNKGLDTNALFIKTIIANKASTPWHYGRQRRRKMKRTHLEIIVEEKEIPKEKLEKKAELKEKPKEEPKETAKGPKETVPKAEELKKKPEKKKQEKPKKKVEEKKPETKK